MDGWVKSSQCCCFVLISPNQSFLSGCLPFLHFQMISGRCWFSFTPFTVRLTCHLLSHFCSGSLIWFLWHRHNWLPFASAGVGKKIACFPALFPSFFFAGMHCIPVRAAAALPQRKEKKSRVELYCSRVEKTEKNKKTRHAGKANNSLLNSSSIFSSPASLCFLFSPLSARHRRSEGPCNGDTQRLLYDHLMNIFAVIVSHMPCSSLGWIPSNGLPLGYILKVSNQETPVIVRAE